MRVLITGAGGMLGRRLAELLPSAMAYDRNSLDLTDFAAVRDAVSGQDLVINAAAWTDVDGAETQPQQADAINGYAVSQLAELCGPRLIHVSTDYVFSGNATTPYAEDAPTAPLNAYGRSKLIGEQAVLSHRGYVVRTAWLYDNTGRNFVTTMLRLASTQDTVEVVDDQHGQPTWARHLAAQIIALGLSDAPAGVYHGTASGQTTWHGLASAVFALSGLDPARVRPTTSDKFVRPAARPAYSVLGHSRWALAGLKPQPDWHDQLAEALSSS